ncbi:unnamed protein product [Cladocopium goreaui]|uniref:SF3 helicase domain-containing protein n=1 Tax=Cladocopium goreaui TaxID=2562237 RepID=A0A9P1CDR0_9DINO|nr:unnamed protein product [Cladocopium goreaui]
MMELMNCIASMNVSNYQMSTKQKLLLIMLVDGEHWRAHDRQMFYYENGVWKMKPSLTIEVWDLFLAVEGLLLTVSKHFEDQEGDARPAWNWNAIRDVVSDTIQGHVHDALHFFGNVAKEASDHLRQVTSNKAWKALWLRRCADMLASFRVNWDSNKVQSLSKLFLLEWDTPLPKSQGVCFRDVYLDADWKPASKSPSNDCYMHVDYAFYIENLLQEYPNINLQQHQEGLRLFLESLYFQNEHIFQVKLCFLHAAFKKACTSKMIFEIGKGGDGKGMEAYLDRAVLGEDQSATLDCGVFLDRQEFRKSAEFAWNKANVRIQEMDQHARFVADLWKRFIVDEEIDCRVNYGFTSKRRFGSSMKVQELNFENIPTIEECRDRLQACEHLKRRIVCFRMGKARFVLDDHAVNYEHGVFRLIPQDELVPFLTHPATASCFFRDWCLPFFQENSLDECLKMILDLSHVHEDLVNDTNWLASRLSGWNGPPPGTDIDLQTENDELITIVHRKTPMKTFIKEYLISKVEDIPGAVQSTRGRRTKLQFFLSALDHSTIKLFRQHDQHAFEKLLVDWASLAAAMDAHGGALAFGQWKDWGCTFDLRHLQQEWESNLFVDLQNECQGNVTHHGSLSSQIRPTVATLQETVDLEALQAYLESGSDRRTSQLRAYVDRHASEGVRVWRFSTISVEYYKAPNYGRLLARGPAAQKLTREARGKAFPHAIEIDAACCHPRLLLRKLRDMGLDEAGSFQMLRLFCENYKSWRSVLAQYLCVDVQEAKKELLRIFYGGNPRFDIPWLRKLGEEVQAAAHLILQDHRHTHLSDLYNDRRHPEFSRLCSLLSFDEADLLDTIRTHAHVKMEVALFDGGIVSCTSVQDLFWLHRACAETSHNIIPVEIKSEPQSMKTFLHMLVCKNIVNMMEVEIPSTPANCLLFAVQGVAPHVDLSSLRQVLQDKPESSLSAHQFNEALADADSAADTAWQLHCISKDELLSVVPAHPILCHERSGECQGHWWSFVMIEDEARLFDSEIPSFEVTARWETFASALEKSDALTFFELKQMHLKTTFFELKQMHLKTEMSMSEAYHLQGRGRADGSSTVKSVRTPLKNCALCPETVLHQPMRCGQKSCQASHYYNFVWSNGIKTNSLDPNQAEYIFVTANTGFHVSFLAYHDALQFRGYLSNHAIAWSQTNALWADDHAHARFHKDYALAHDPVHEGHLRDFHRWWQTIETPHRMSQSVKEIAVDGHEKIATKCYHEAPARGGRPRKDGHVKLFYNGWFMATHPGTGVILGLFEMKDPENSDVAAHQLGDRLAGRVDVPDHPVINLLKSLPPFKGSPLPDWIPGSVCELHTGKVGGVLKGGRFLLQRPAGAVPERLALESEMLLTHKERRRSTAIAATLGVAFAALVGVSLHLREWLRGQTEVSRKTWPQLGVWLLYAPVLVTPASALPCYGLSNSPGSTFCVVAAINLLFYSDLFSE